MARLILGALLIALPIVTIGCNQPETGGGAIQAKSQDGILEYALLPVDATEADMVEKVSTSRNDYKANLKNLVEFYKQQGNNMKLSWAEEELEMFGEMNTYRYIIEVEVAGPELRATTQRDITDYIYQDGMKNYKKDEYLFGAIKSEESLRKALVKFNRIIREFPDSDKIDDAAYRAGEIHEHFKDYSIALLYYQRAYTWDPETIHPARYKAASILEERFGRNREALALYREFLEDASKKAEFKSRAIKRIEKLTKPGQEIEPIEK